MIEGINIEYGKIENCKIDTILASKISRRLKSNTNDVNIEFSIENGKIETVTSNLASTYLTSTEKWGQTGSPVGWGGPLLMMIGDAMTPFDPKGDPV